MANSTCLITSINELLDKAEGNLLNITSMIDLCPEICSLAWGKGNPDLSGIGASTSYIFQAILTVLCGPVTGLAYIFRHRLGRVASPIEDQLTKLSHSFIDISSTFNIPVGIAAAARMNQSPPFFEQFFLVQLLDMQMFSFMAVLSVIILVFDNQHRGRCSIRALYFGIQVFLVIFVSNLQTMKNSRWRSSKELINGCKSYKQVAPFIIPTAEQWTAWPNQNTMWVAVAIFGINICFIAFSSLKRTLWERGWRAMKHMIVFTVFSHILIIVAVSFTVYFAWSLGSMRNKFKTISDADSDPDLNQDDQWGFGQIIALCLWIPLSVQVVYYATCFFWYISNLNSPGWVRWIQDTVNPGNTETVEDRYEL